MVSSDESLQKTLVCSLEDEEYEPSGSFSSSSSAIVSKTSARDVCDDRKKRLSFLMRSKADVKSPEGDAVFRFQRFCNRGSNALDVASARVLRRRKKDKWKSCFIVLRDTNGSQLSVYETEKSTKPKVILDLCYCFLYKIDESVAYRANCLFIAANGPEMCTSILLSFLSFCDFLQWFGYLRRRCIGFRHSISPFTVISISSNNAPFSSLSFIYLTVCDYRGTNLNAEHEYSTCVLVNSVRITQTTPAAPTAKNYVPFNTAVLIENIPSGPCSLQLQLCSYKSAGKQHNLKPCYRASSALFPLLDDGSELCVNAEGRGNGFVFNAVRHRVTVFTETDYSSFFSLLTSDSFALCIWTATMLNKFNRHQFARHLLTLFLPTQSVFLSFIEVVLQGQLEREAAATVFRLDTFCSCCIRTALCLVGRDVVLDELSPLLQQLHSDKPSNVNVETFIGALRTLTSRLPRLFGAILARVAQAVRNRFPDESHCARRAVSSFFFLRFINPILTYWDITDGPARKLANKLQKAANQATALNFDPRTAERAPFLVSQILDGFVATPPDMIPERNPFSGYGKEEQFAMVAFQIGRVLDEKPGRCPLHQAASVLLPLRPYAETSSEKFEDLS